MAHDAGDRLARALHAAAAGAQVALTIEAVRSTRWASATFVGARHCLRATARDDDALAHWLVAVPAHEFMVRGQLVADLTIDSVERCAGQAAIIFAALTVEEA